MSDKNCVETVARNMRLQQRYYILKLSTRGLLQNGCRRHFVTVLESVQFTCLSCIFPATFSSSQLSQQKAFHSKSGCKGYVPTENNQMFPQSFILSSHKAGVSWLCIVSCDVPGCKGFLLVFWCIWRVIFASQKPEKNSL